MRRRRSQRVLAPAAFAFALAGVLAIPQVHGDPTKSPGAAASAKLPEAVAGNLDLSADLLEVDVKGQTATLTGNVLLAKGGDLSLRCPKIDVRYDSGGPRVQWAKGSGGVVADVKGVRGEAPEFELDWVAQKLVLRGGVRLFRGQGWVVADGAEIDLASARITMTNVRASLPVGAALKK